MVGGVISRVLTMVSAILVARLLGKEGYGEMGMIQSTMGMFGVLAGLGLGATATKYVAEYRQKDPVRAGRITSLTLVTSLVSAGGIALCCFLLAPELAARTLNRGELAPLLVAGAVLLFVSTLGGVLSAVLSGFESFKEIAVINLWQGVSTPLLSIPLVYWCGVEGAIASFTINAALGLILTAIAVRREARRYSIPLGFDRGIWQEWRLLWSYSLPLTLANLLVAPVTWVTNSILVNQPGGYGELGLFNAANQWRNVIVFIPALLSSAMLPVLSETHGRENKDDFSRTIVLNLRGTWLVAFPLTVVVILLGKPLAMLLGKQFAGTDQIISVLMVATFLNVVNSAVGCVLVGAGRIWIGTLMNMCWAAVLIGVSYLLIPGHGGTGLAIAYLAAYLTHTVWQMAYVEFKLAPGSISTQLKTLSFSAVVLVATLAVGGAGRGFLALSLVLVAASLLPLLFTLKAALPLRGAQQPLG
ncbi:oligosaccharide flippase family protein [Geomonas sp. Red32]|nr:oligosaccharide flippase family protein [Geomonas sp. Red32]